MKILKVLTPGILVLTLISTILLLGVKTFTVFVVLPYIILLILSYINKDKEDAQHYTLFIISIIVCPITFFNYREVQLYPGSSTSGLVFAVLPVYSVIFIVVGFFAINWVVANVLIANRNIKVAATITGVVIFGWLVYSMIPGPNAYKQSRNFKKRQLTKNIEEAKKKHVFVKELHYQVDGFGDLPELKPYLEKGFKFGEDSMHFAPYINTDYPFRLGFNQYPVDSIFVYVKDEDMHKFDSSNGDGSFGASGFLAKPTLPDTITLGIRKAYVVSGSNVVLGSIKVWD